MNEDELLSSKKEMMVQTLENLINPHLTDLINRQIQKLHNQASFWFQHPVFEAIKNARSIVFSVLVK